MEEQMNELINRGNNILVVGLLSFVGIGLVGEFFSEVEWRDKGDDILIVLLAIIAAVWFFSGRNRYKFSWYPFILLAISTIVKVGTLFAEFNDQVARGDELGLVLPLLVLTVVCGISIYRSQRRNKMPIQTPEHEMMSQGVEPK